MSLKIINYVFNVFNKKNPISLNSREGQFKKRGIFII